MNQNNQTNPQQFFDNLERRLDNSYKNFLIEVTNIKGQVGRIPNESVIEQINHQFQQFMKEADAIEKELANVAELSQKDRDQEKLTEIRAKIAKMVKEGETEKQTVSNNVHSSL